MLAQRRPKQQVLGTSAPTRPPSRRPSAPTRRAVSSAHLRPLGRVRAHRSGEQALAAGDRGGLGAAGGLQLAEDVGDVDRDGLGADEQLLADLAVRAALGDQRQDLALAGGERRRGAASSRTGADPTARSSSSSGWAPSRWAASRARSPCSRAAGGVAGRAQDPGEHRAGRGPARARPRSPRSSDASSRQASTSTSSGGASIAGQPAQPQRLGVEPLRPGAALGAPVARTGRCSARAPCGRRRAAARRGRGTTPARPPTSRRHRRRAPRRASTAASRIRALNHSCQIAVEHGDHVVVHRDGAAGVAARARPARISPRRRVDGDPALPRPEAAQRRGPRRPRRRRGPARCSSAAPSSSAREIGGGDWCRTSQSASTSSQRPRTCSTQASCQRASKAYGAHGTPAPLAARRWRCGTTARPRRTRPSPRRTGRAGSGRAARAWTAPLSSARATASTRAARSASLGPVFLSPLSVVIASEASCVEVEPLGEGERVQADGLGLLVAAHARPASGRGWRATCARRSLRVLGQPARAPRPRRSTGSSSVSMTIRTLARAVSIRDRQASGASAGSRSSCSGPGRRGPVGVAAGHQRVGGARRRAWRRRGRRRDARRGSASSSSACW